VLLGLQAASILDQEQRQQLWKLVANLKDAGGVCSDFSARRWGTAWWANAELRLKRTRLYERCLSLCKQGRRVRLWSAHAGDVVKVSVHAAKLSSLAPPKTSWWRDRVVET